MSTSIFKVPYKCDCGCDYGDCGVECAVILKSNNSCDVYTLYHTDSHKYKGNATPKTSKGGLDCFTDNYLSALGDVISMNIPNVETLTEQEREVVFSNF